MSEGRQEIFSCEHGCGKRLHDEDRVYMEFHDEYWCASCADNEAEAAYDRQQERDLESPLESAREAQIRLWEEHKLLHRR